MSIFMDENTPIGALQWDKEADFSENLEKFNSLFYDLMLRNDIVTDKPELAKVAEDFVKSLAN